MRTAMFRIEIGRLFLKSKELEQFYTNPKIAKECVEVIKKHFSFDDYDYILEPSAGTGSFFNLLPVSKRIGIDLQPKSAEILEQDFFDYTPLDGKYLVIGNPPFGKNSKLAIKFFNRSGIFANDIGFVVPNTFNKTSVRNRLDLNFGIVENIPLPKNSFIFNDKEYDVPCSFQIWSRIDEPRKKIILPTTHPDFAFTTRDQADFAIQRVGAAAGKIKLDFAKVADASHYFIKDNNNSLAVLQNIDWTRVKYNTAGNPSIAKTELIEAYTKYIDQTYEIAV
jgi:hypothetical protein